MIVFDLQAVQSVEQGERGIARYTGEVAHALQRHHPDVVDVFAYNDLLPYAPRLDRLGLGDKLRSFSELRGVHVDLLHVNSPFELPGIAALNTPVVAARTVVTCYDLIPYRFSDIYLPEGGRKAWYQTRLGMLLAADAIVTDSESAAEDTVRMLGFDPDHITSIGAGTAAQFVPPTDTLADRMHELRKVAPDLLPGFILIPAGPEWRKNLDGAIDAYGCLDPHLRARHQLVVASKIADGQRTKFAKHCAARGVLDDVIVTGFVSDEDLVRLYQSADIVMFPSLYEGFGLPVLEARRCGARVICSNVSSLPEVMLEPDALFNPYDIDDMATKLEAALTDTETIVRLDRARDPGFTWELAASRLVEVYQRVRATIGDQTRRRRPRIALTAALPFDDPDTARRNAAFFGRIAEFADITVFVPADASRLSEDWGFSVHNIRVLPAHHAAGDFDEVFYGLGDDELHGAARTVIDVVPGRVIIRPFLDDDSDSDRADELIARSAGTIGADAVDEDELIEELRQALA